MTINRLQNIETWIRGHYFGKYRGTVVDNNDFTGRGRIQVNVPAVLGTENVWALPCVPYAGPDVGLVCLPPTGAGVWVEFEAGDPSYPVWTGCFWADGELPSEVVTADTRVLKTEQTLIKVDDMTGEMLITNDQNASVTLSQDVTTSAGAATHTVGGVGVVSEASPGKVEVGASGVSVNNGALTVM
jgi:uncharacterized protein involved in type VI secretion and phage assembly